VTDLFRIIMNYK